MGRPVVVKICHHLIIFVMSFTFMDRHMVVRICHQLIICHVIHGWVGAWWLGYVIVIEKDRAYYPLGYYLHKPR